MDRRLNQNKLIEDALTSQPMAPMPRSITLEVMSKIQSSASKRPALITWDDVGLSFAITSCIAALWFTAENLPPLVMIKLRIQGILLYQDFLVNARWLLPVLFFGMAAFLAAITIPSLYKMTMDHGPQLR